MSNLLYTVMWQNAAQSGWTVTAYNAADFIGNPSYNAGVPSQSADSSGQSSAFGAQTLSGLDGTGATTYWLVTTDPFGFNNWFLLPPGFIGTESVFILNVPYPPPPVRIVTSPSEGPYTPFTGIT